MLRISELSKFLVYGWRARFTPHLHNVKYTFHMLLFLPGSTGFKEYWSSKTARNDL